VLKAAICDLFGIKHPVTQGGMVHIGTAELVSVVSNTGARGIIGCGIIRLFGSDKNPSHQTKTSKPFGINIPMI
jgi:NAD(P)H-dependent flavin oxidoreductase YrpB (nitropropane dioxygenase family)